MASSDLLVVAAIAAGVYFLNIACPLSPVLGFNCTSQKFQNIAKSVVPSQIGKPPSADLTGGPVGQAGGAYAYSGYSSAPLTVA